MGCQRKVCTKKNQDRCFSLEIFRIYFQRWSTNILCLLFGTISGVHYPLFLNHFKIELGKKTSTIGAQNAFPLQQRSFAVLLTKLVKLGFQLGRHLPYWTKCENLRGKIKIKIVIPNNNKLFSFILSFPTTVVYFMTFI